MNNASVRGGRTRFLKEGDVFGVVSFFTGAEQMEVRVEREHYLLPVAQPLILYQSLHARGTCLGWQLSSLEQHRWR